jgi:hypothetical protein
MLGSMLPRLASLVEGRAAARLGAPAVERGCQALYFIATTRGRAATLWRE